MQKQTETGTERRGKGFLGSLFDLSFRNFVTGRVVSFLYVISLILVTLNALFSAGYSSVLLGTFLTAVGDSSALAWLGGVVLFLILAPLFLFVSIVYVRVILEIVVVLFRIADSTAESARVLGGLDAGLVRDAAVGATNRRAEEG